MKTQMTIAVGTIRIVIATGEQSAKLTAAEPAPPKLRNWFIRKVDAPMASHQIRRSTTRDEKEDQPCDR
jgi:hypothetical protein